MKKILSLLSVGALAVACTTNPMTGRSSFHGFSDNSQLVLQATQEYNKAKQSYKTITGTKDSEMVVKVGNRIKAAAEQYYTSIGKANLLSGFNWEFNLFDDPKTLNAWCMPGGKAAVFTGILPICKDETGLATVMGHEIAHALANHSSERMSSQVGAQLLGSLGGGLIGNAGARSVFEQLYPIGASLTVLSYSRKQELEADQMGIYLMAMAGYNPQLAPQLWERMKSATKGQDREADFLSTHPNPDARIADMNKNMAKAMEYYNKSIYKK